MKKQIKRVQAGFTLVELVVVVVIVGILVAVFTTLIRGSGDGAKANAIQQVAQGVQDTWSLINQSCGTTTTVTGSPIPAAGKTVSDVIFGGVANVAASYTTCYNASNVKTLAEVAQLTGTAGVYAAQGFNVAIAGGGPGASLQVSFASVPDTITLLAAQKFNPQLATLAASDTTSSVFQYSTATSGLRTDTFFKY